MSGTIGAAELRTWLADGRPVTIRDVRSTEQRQDWQIPGSLHADLYESLEKGDADAVVRLDLPVGRPVVTVCAAGRSSAVAANEREAGGSRCAIG